MQKIKVNLKKILKEEVDLIVDYLKRGKVIVYPTDTVYGLGCAATDKKAINKIYRIKQREKGKPLLVLVKSWCMLKKYCYVSKKQEEYLRKVWKQERQFKNSPNLPLIKGGRSVSVILRGRGLLPKELTGSGEDLAVRLPKNDFLSTILKRVNVPIVSTSLNISGRKTLTDLSRLNAYFKKEKPDLLVDAGRIAAKSSKLIDLRDINNIKVLRK